MVKVANLPAENGDGFCPVLAEQRVQTLRTFQSFTSLFYSKPTMRAWDFCDLLNFYINTNKSLQWASNVLFSQRGFIAGQLDPSSFWQVIHFLHQYRINSHLSIHLKLEPSKDYYIGKISGKEVGAFLWGIHWLFLLWSLVSHSSQELPQFPHLAMLLSHHSLLHPPRYLREMSGSYLHEPVDSNSMEITQERFQSFLNTVCCILHQVVYNSDTHWLKNPAAKQEITNHLQNLHSTRTIHFRCLVLDV